MRGTHDSHEFRQARYGRAAAPGSTPSRHYASCVIPAEPDAVSFAWHFCVARHRLRRRTAARIAAGICRAARRADRAGRRRRKARLCRRPMVARVHRTVAAWQSRTSPVERVRAVARGLDARAADRAGLVRGDLRHGGGSWLHRFACDKSRHRRVCGCVRGNHGAACSGSGLQFPLQRRGKGQAPAQDQSLAAGACARAASRQQYRLWRPYRWHGRQEAFWVSCCRSSGRKPIPAQATKGTRQHRHRWSFCVTCGICVDRHPAHARRRTERGTHPAKRHAAHRDRGHGALGRSGAPLSAGPARHFFRALSYLKVRELTEAQGELRIALSQSDTAGIAPKFRTSIR